MKGAGGQVQAHPGEVGDEAGGLLDRAGGGLGVLAVDRGEHGGLRCTGEQLRELSQDPGVRAGFVEQLAQGLNEHDLVDRTAQLLTDLRQGGPGYASGGADALDAGAVGHRVLAFVVAMSAARVSQPWCQVLSRWKAPFMPKSARR